MRIALATFFALAALSACTTPPARDAGARAVAERLFEAFNRHDAAAMRALYAPDAMHISPAFCSPKRGPEEIASVYQGLFTSLPDVHDEVVQIVAEGDHAAVRFVARSKSLPQPLLLAAFIQVRDGRIVREETFYDVAGPCRA
jgi:ketosteroid isomerase-like protein